MFEEQIKAGVHDQDSNSIRSHLTIYEPSSSSITGT